MAIYRFELKVHSRRQAATAPGMSAYRSGSVVVQKNSSMLATAAYRSAEQLADQATGLVHDFRRKENVVSTEILAPENAPRWVYDRSALWNAVEASERRKDAQLAREALLTIPRELSPDQAKALVRAFVKDQFVARGMIADIAIHDPDASDGERQPHAHVLLTMRDVGPGGFGLKRRDWNDIGLQAKAKGETSNLMAWREQWQIYCNAALAEAGSDARVDHRSLRDRGLADRPQPKIGPARHLSGAAKWAAKRYEELGQVKEINHAIQIGRAMSRAIERGYRFVAPLAAEAMRHAPPGRAGLAVRTFRVVRALVDPPPSYDPWGYGNER